MNPCPCIVMAAGGAPSPLSASEPHAGLFRRARRRAAVALLAGAALAGLMAPPAHAGQTCDAHRLTTQDVVQGLNLAEATARALDASGAEVVVLARAGQDLRRWGLQWSHLGLAYRVAPPAGAGQVGTWRVVHKLNTCGTASAGLYRQGLGEFFMDQPWRYAAAFSPLHTETQKRLLPLLRDNTRTQAVHTPDYNMLAYPWSVRYQQSNQWVLETIAASMTGLSHRSDAQTVLRGLHYEPALLDIGAATRLGAHLTRANVAFDDQPWGERLAGRIRTVTAESVFAWLQQTQMGGVVRQVAQVTGAAAAL